ncbi:MAG: glucosaminidase domain-containing protein [Tannerella sp.]|jgi:flagellum-specific peptidoglycan hydrolase FlgJ|nr:glucosaminidase domain-containing protein [Tannerella sp.]
MTNNKTRKTIAVIYVILTFITFAVEASTPESKNRSVYREYIRMYYQAAMQQQRKYKIPASITLAQAILESNAGQSYLAIAANNHFGVKCNSWTGLCVYKNDAGQYCCFRKYLDVSDSYEDHSRFLKERPFYEPLFKLSDTDYKGWAKGLGRCGYANDPQYASKLIRLIEDYRLYEYDREAKGESPASTTKNTIRP